MMENDRFRRYSAQRAYTVDISNTVEDQFKHCFAKTILILEGVTATQKARLGF
jgi:hypothetical protein